MSRTFCAAALLAMSGLALASSGARAAGRDALAACPQLAGHLQDELQPAVVRYDKPGRMQVSFRWQDDRATDVTVVGAPWQYHYFVRRAIRSAQCSQLSPQAVYVLDIEFRDS